MLSLIIPIYNEEKNIFLLYNRICTVLEQVDEPFELLFINDGSQDKSLILIKSLAEQDERIKYINFSRNFGHQVAVSAGLDHARGQAVVIMDADLQDPPELIPAMYQKMKEGFDVVYAKRKKREGESFIKLFTAKMFYRLLSKITAIQIPLDTGDFRIISQKVVNVLRKMPERNKYLRGQISWVGFPQTFVEYNRGERANGKSGYTYGKMLRFALDGITSFSSFPLKLASILGFVVSGIAFIVMLFAVYAHLFRHATVQGWTSLIISVLFIGGIQLISIGIIGEYISRINTDVRNRPLYIVSDSNISETIQVGTA